MSRLEGRVGPVALSDGAIAEVRMGDTGELAIGQAHGRHHEAVSRRTVYHAAMQAGGALGTALTASAVTLTLYNPAGSGVVLSLVHCSAGVTVAPAGQAVLVYAVNANPLAAAPTATTPATVRCNLLGASTGRGQAYVAATLPAAPTVARVLANLSANANAQGISDDVGGLLELPENTAVTIQSIGAALSGIVALSWEEIPA